MTHFEQNEWGTPAASGRYVSDGDVVPFDILPGLQFRPVIGETTLTNFVHFQPNTEAPLHAHEEEQIVLVLQGEFEFNIDGSKRLMRAGDVAVVPSWVPHGARTYDVDCTEVDFFAPPRSSLIEYARKQVDRNR